MTVPYYTLGAFPTAHVRLKGFFAEAQDSPGWLLTQSPRFRGAGFDLSTSGYGQLVDGEYWEAASGDRKRVRLYQDGTLLFRARADSAFLGWGQDPGAFATHPALNPVAVVESHAAFCAVYSLLLQHLSAPAASIRVNLAFQDGAIGTRRLFLTNYHKDGVRRWDDPKQHPIHALDASDKVDIAYEVMRTAPMRAAYTLLLRFYGLFDADQDLIPFVRVAGGVGEVDLEAIKAL